MRLGHRPTSWTAIHRLGAAALVLALAPPVAAQGVPPFGEAALPAEPSSATIEPAFSYGPAASAPPAAAAVQNDLGAPALQAPTPSVAAVAEAKAVPASLKLGVFGTNLWAGRGARRTASAYSMPVYSIGLNVGLEFFSSKRLFVTGDTSTESLQHFALSFSPVKGMEVAVSGRSLAFQYRDARVPRNLMLQGNPGLQVKYGHHVYGPLALGARASLLVPASASGSGISLNSITLHGDALVSVQPLPWLEWTANVGYIFDRAARQYGGRNVDAVQRFVYNVNEVDRLFWGTSATARFAVRGRIDITPFVEFSGESGVGGGATARNSPALAAVGVRLTPSRSRALELTVGSDVALAGGPQLNSPFGGVPPYQAFALLSVHFHDWAPAVRRKAKAEPVRAAIDTFLVEGQALEQQSGKPVQGLRLAFVGDGNALVTSDPSTGQFASYPLARDARELSVHAEAPGFLPLDEHYPRPATGNGAILLKFIPSMDAATLATLKGNVRHAYTAQPVTKAHIDIEGQAPLAVDRRGAFSASLRPGSYAVTIRAPGFLPQHRTFVVSSSQSIVFSVDLEPESR